MIEIKCIGTDLAYRTREFQVHYNWMHSDTGDRTDTRFINGIKHEVQLAIL